MDSRFKHRDLPDEHFYVQVLTSNISLFCGKKKEDNLEIIYTIKLIAKINEMGGGGRGT